MANSTTTTEILRGEPRTKPAPTDDFSSDAEPRMGDEEVEGGMEAGGPEAYSSSVATSLSALPLSVHTSL